VACRRCLDDPADRCPACGSPTEATLAGSRVLDGKLELERRLGEGGMGAVYRARHVSLGRSMAVKLIRRTGVQDAGYVARFRSEAAALGRLKHPAIVDVSDFGLDARDGGVPYLVMELLEGVSLDEHCARVGVLSLAEAVPILEGIAEAVDFAHRSGVIHRDLKPSNVLLLSDSSVPRVKLLDFGLACLDSPTRKAVGWADFWPETDDKQNATTRVADPAAPDWRGQQAGIGRAETITRPGSAAGESSSVPTTSLGSPVAELAAGSTQPGELIGTPPFMAPERFKGAASPDSDVYALGVIAYLLLTGQTPFSGSLGAIVRGHQQEPPPPPSGLCPALGARVDAVILRSLEKDPARRQPSAGALARELAAVAHERENRAWYARELPRRLTLALGLALAAAVAAPGVASLPPVASLERAALDARLALAPARTADPRLLIVLIDDASLAGEPRSLAEMAEPIATELERVFDAGAAGIAIDLLLPEPWGRSRTFARLVVARHERLVLAAHAGDGGFVGPEALSGLSRVALGEARADEAFGLVNLDEDPDGVVRRGRLRFATEGGGTARSWAAAAARVLGADPVEPPSFILDSRDIPAEARIPWRELPSRLSSEPSRFKDRLVLLGAQLSGSGDETFRVSPPRAGRATLPGVLVQARAIDTILAGFPIREAVGSLVLAGTATLAGLVAAAVLLGGRVGIGATPVALVAWPVAAWAGFVLSRRIVPVAAPIVLIASVAILALLLRRVLPAPPWQKRSGR